MSSPLEKRHAGIRAFGYIQEIGSPDFHCFRNITKESRLDYFVEVTSALSIKTTILTCSRQGSVVFYPSFPKESSLTTIF